MMDEKKTGPHIIAEGHSDIKLANILVKTLSANTASSVFSLPRIMSFHPKKAEEKGNQKALFTSQLLREFTDLGIDPRLFDLMLSNENDRNLKRQFGFWFMGATFVFTLLSYGVIILNSIRSWGISEIAITALIIETPLQFIGLLYIIARNLFPQKPLPIVVGKAEPDDPRKGSFGYSMVPSIPQAYPPQANS